MLKIIPKVAALRRFASDNLTSKQSQVSWYLIHCVRFASADAQNRTRGQDFDREAFNRRQKRLVAAIIGSSVGLIGSSYCLYRKLCKANAESPHSSIKYERINNTDERSGEHEKESDEEVDGQKGKERKGFRERRVREIIIIYFQIIFARQQ